MTGGYGFLGSHLVRRLLSLGNRVTVLDITNRPAVDLPEADGRLRFIRGSVTDASRVTEAVDGAEAIVHLAAIASPRACEERPDEAHAVNVQGTENLLDAAKDGTRLVFLSSAAVYGAPQHLPIDEGHSLLGTDRYALTKRAAEQLCFAHRGRLHLTVVRNFNTYGPGQSPDYLIPKVVQQALRDHRIEVWNTSPVRDYTFVDDTVAALTTLTSLNGSSPSLLNLGSGEGHSVADVLSALRTAVGDLEIRDLDKPVTGSPALIADNRLALESLAWRPSVSLTTGIERTVEWFRTRSH